MVTQESEISAPRSCNWHCEHSTKASGNKHCKWVSHMVRTTLLYGLSASHLLLSDLPLPSINLMIWQRARLIKRNFFCSHLWLTMMQQFSICSRFRTGQASVSTCWTNLCNVQKHLEEMIFSRGFYLFCLRKQMVVLYQKIFERIWTERIVFLLLGFLKPFNCYQSSALGEPLQTTNITTHFRCMDATNDQR